MCLLLTKFTILAFVLIFQYEASCEVICETDGCMTYEDMGRRWAWYFENEKYNKYAPCLQFGKGQDQLGRLKYMWCLKNKAGYWKKCRCYDNETHYPNKWCNPSSYGHDHTMCLYENNLKSNECGEIKARGVISQEDKDAILDKHNELRAKVANGQEKRGVDGGQPKAANMRKLIWNDELAEIAQRWVDRCKPEEPHDRNRRTERFPVVGQNGGWDGHMGNSYEELIQQYPKQDFFKYIVPLVIQDWYDEVADFAQSDFKVTEDRFKDWSKPIIGHYTQTVWAETYQIGCGYIVYANKDKNATAANNKMKQSKITKTGGTGWATYYDVESVFVCNYGPGGNLFGQSLYKVGEPGSECPSGTANTGKGLCA